MSEPILILGAGVTGLAAGAASGGLVLEAEGSPGGLCASYYMTPSGQRLDRPPTDGEAYRFEIGGGHWIWGADALAEKVFRRFSTPRCHGRSAAAYLPERELLVPAPLQHALGRLGPEAAHRAVVEILEAREQSTSADNLDEHLRLRFGRTLHELFFGPFHDLYTAGLSKQVEPPDDAKSPLSIGSVLAGAFGATPKRGYNARFLYPAEGLDAVARGLAAQGRVEYGASVEAIDLEAQQVCLGDGRRLDYETLASTLPLDTTLRLAGLEADPGEAADPATSALVLNLGARRGRRFPYEQWIYVPRSRSGLHRVGFYSSVDESFLPASARDQGELAALYVERAWRRERPPSEQERTAFVREAIAELNDWGWIREVEVADLTWAQTAYAWKRPGSGWRVKALRALESRGVAPLGRYGRWETALGRQGVVENLRAGFAAGAALRCAGVGGRRTYEASDRALLAAG